MLHPARRLKTIALILALAIPGSIRAMAADADPSANGPPILFSATLSPDEEIPPTDSKGTGTANFVLNRSDLKLTWKVTFKDLTGPVTAASIHGPERPGGNAPMIIDLAAHGLKSPLEGSATLDEIQLLYFLNGRVYVNLHTAKYKDGEIRGQIERHAAAQPSNK